MAASRSALGQSEHRFRQLRQLHAADGLDDRRRRSGRSELARAKIQWHLAARTDATRRLGFERAAHDLLNAYLKGNIEGGQYFDWFYNDSNNLGRGLDPKGTDLQVSLPEGDRLAQARNPYFPDQEILANKQLRWWWNNNHQAVYDSGDGQGFAPHGPKTEWNPNAKSIIMLEYGFAACDKSTNQPNVFFDPKSTESFTAYWSIWDPANEGGYLPRRDDTIQALALQAVYEYWNVDGNNESVGGVPMLNWTFCCVWNTDARPFPTFPILNSAWGDTGNWPQGIGSEPPAPSCHRPRRARRRRPGISDLPGSDTLAWSVHIKPKFKRRSLSM